MPTRRARGIRSLPVVARAFRWRLRVQTHRQLRRSRIGPIDAARVVLSTSGRYVFHGRVADGRSVYVKSRRRADLLEAEARMLVAAADTGAPVAGLVEYVSGRPAVIVTEAVSGVPLEIGSPERDWTTAGQALRRLHDLGTRDPACRAADPGAWASDWAQMVRGELSEARRTGRLHQLEVGRCIDWAIDVIVETIPAELTLIHGDCMPKHVILDRDGGASFIDLDAAGVGDPRFDLAVLTTYVPERLDAVLRGYGRQDPEVRTGVQAYWVVRLLKALNWSAVHGYETDSTRERLGELATEIDESRPEREHAARR